MALNLNTIIKLSAQVTGLGSLDQLNTKLKDSSKSAASVGGIFKGLGGAITGALAGVASVGAVLAFTKSLINMGDELWTIHERTGIAVEDLSKFQGAAEQSGTSLDAVAKGINRLNKSLGEQGKAFEILKKLGVDTTNATKAMLGIADVMKATEDPALKAALAIEIFGKAGAELVPMLQNGSGEIEGMANAMSTEFAQAADEFNDAINEIKRELAGGIAAEGTSSLQELTRTLNDPDIRVGIVGIINGIIEITKFAIEGAAAIYALGDAFMDTFRDVENKTTKGLNIELVDAEMELDRWRKDAHPDWIKNQTEKIAALRAELDVRNKAAQAKAPSARTPNEAAAAAKPGGTDALLRNLLKTPTPERKETREERERERAIKNNEKIILQLNAEAASLGKTNLERERSAAIADLEAAGIAKGTKEYNARLAAVDNLHNAKFDEDLRKIKDALDLEIEAMRINTDEFGLSSLQIEINSKMREYDLLLKRESIGLTEAETVALKELIEAKKAEAKAELERREAQKGDWMGGMKQGIREYYDSIKDVASATKDVMVQAFQGMEDALLEFVTTGKMNFKSFAAEIIKEILRIWIRYMIIKPLMDALGVAFPSFGAAMAGTRALGGAVAGGSSYLVGENGPELFTPSNSGRITPNTQMGGGNNVSVVVNVNAETGATSTSGDGGDMAKLGKMIGSRVREEIIMQRRVGGLLAG
jgi:lambda family phage tail tape measure protein